MSLTTVTDQLSITIPKRVRDNIGLAPFDCVSFEADDKSYYLTKVKCASHSTKPRINEAPASYDAQLDDAQISSVAEVPLPRSIVHELRIESGSVVGLFRATVGYRLVHLFAPSEGGLIEDAFGLGSESEWPDAFDNVIQEYSVQISKEVRAELFYGWEQSNRIGDDEPFSNVNEPLDDREILDSLPIAPATTRH